MLFLSSLAFKRGENILTRLAICAIILDNGNIDNFKIFVNIPII